MELTTKLSLTESLLAVIDFLQALGFNTDNIEVHDMIHIKNNILKGLNECDDDVKKLLTMPSAKKITDKF